MKRLLSLALSLALIFAFAPAQALAAPIEIESMEYIYVATVKVSGSEDITEDIVVHGRARQLVLSETNIQMEMEMVMTAEGETITAKSYFKDDYAYYIYSDDTKFKTRMSIEEMLQQANVVHHNSNAIPSQYIISQRKSFESNTWIRHEMVIDGQYMMDLLGWEYLYSGIKYGEMTIVTWEEVDGTPIQVQTEYTMYVTDGDTTMQMDTTMLMHVVDINHIDNINFPADLASFPEIEL